MPRFNNETNSFVSSTTSTSCNTAATTKVARERSNTKFATLHNNNFSPPQSLPPPVEDVHIIQHYHPNRTMLRPSRPRKPSRGAGGAFLMRTRSSRLFLLLIHLVGVSTNVPFKRSSSGGSSSGSNSKGGRLMSSMFSFHRPSFVGAHQAILLERLQIESSRKGLRGIVERVERAWGWDAEVDLLGEPYWFQDNNDGLCLGPNGGFSDCGDATLWRVRRRPLTKKQLREKRYRQRHRKRLEERDRRREKQMSSAKLNDPSSVCVWPFFCEKNSPILQPTHYGFDEIFGFEYDNEVEVEGFALQLTDLDAAAANSSLFVGGMAKERRSFWNTNSAKEVRSQDECLLSYTPSRSGQHEQQQQPTLRLGPCQSEEAWVWHVNRDGILVRGLTKNKVKSVKHGIDLTNLANTKRHTSSNNLNVGSSRSHFICQLQILPLKSQENHSEDVSVTSMSGYSTDEEASIVKSKNISTFWIVDLAGSERSKRTGMGSSRQKEASIINKSLLTLMRCLTAMRESGRQNTSHIIPFRESKLTHLFMGHLTSPSASRTTMVVNVNPAVADFDETQHVLSFLYPFAHLR